MKALVGHAVMGAAALVAIYLLAWEVGQPVTAAHFMLVLGHFDPRVCAIVAPLGMGALMTAFGLLVGVWSYRRGRRAPALAWFIIADLLAPAIALGGHSIAVALVGSPAAL